MPVAEVCGKLIAAMLIGAIAEQLLICQYIKWLQSQ